MTSLLNAALTAQRLPYPALAAEIEALLRDDAVRAPPRLVQALPGAGSLFAMPAHDTQVAIAKLITYTPANAGTGRATVQGDVIVFDIATGERRLILDGPTVTARRTAAVSLVAAQRLAPNRDGPLLIVGAGVQGHAHLEAFAAGLGVQEVWVASRSDASAQALVRHAQGLGLQGRVVADANAALAHCSLVVTATPATDVVLSHPPRDDSFIAAVGAFTPRMTELAPRLCRHMAELGRVVLDTRDADHEAGDLLQAGLEPTRFQTLGDVLRHPPLVAESPVLGPVLFKSCGWAGWDLAAARVALRAPAN